MSTVSHALLDHAVELSRAAGEVTLQWFQETSLTAESKADGTPVTVADRTAERHLRTLLAEAYPHDAIIGEEEAPTPGISGRTWVLDPIDGTKAFTRGVPLYSTLLSLHDADGPAVGVIHMPALGQTVYAGRGLGCSSDGAPARVSSTERLDGSFVSTSGFDTWTGPQIEALRSKGAVLRTWGDGYGFALVATGRIDAMVDPQVSVWDVAGMGVILSEAGGRFTDLRGQPGPRLDPSVPTSGVASNGAIHDELLAALSSPR